MSILIGKAHQGNRNVKSHRCDPGDLIEPMVKLCTSSAISLAAAKHPQQYFRLKEPRTRILTNMKKTLIVTVEIVVG